MSDTGLYSGIYSQLRSFAELLDRVLLSAKANQAVLSTADCEALGRLLIGAAERSAANARTQLLGAVLRESAADQSNLKELGHALLAGVLRPEHIPGLEALARRLENERAGMLGKMRGRGC